ncbi:MAG: diacylglycerol kinase family protein [Coriobacteriales bacterium]|nr:diacylglycerol kinase family protein [Coriobacteriales bacterium]
MSSERPDRRRTLRAAFGYALSGIVHTVRTQRNMRIHLVIALLVLVASALLRLTGPEWAAIIICIVMVLAAETLNTGIEALVDSISPEIHPLAKIAKDAAAGMVLLLAIGAALVGLIIFATALVRIGGWTL